MRRASFYRCGGFHSKGSAVCSNDVPLPLAAVDEAILTEIEGYVLHPQVVARAVAVALDELQPAAGRIEAERKRVTVERSKVERAIERLTTAIADDGAELPPQMGLESWGRAE